MMESVLVLVHPDELGAALSKGSLEAVTAGIELVARNHAPLAIGIVAEHAAKLSTILAATGARVLAVEGEMLSQARYASDAAACEALCRAAQPAIVLAPQSSRFARVMGAVAYRMHGTADTHITALGGTDGLEAGRWFYRQRIEAVIMRAIRPWFLLLEGGTHVPYAGDAGQANVEQVALEMPALRTTVKGIHVPEQAGNPEHFDTIRPDAKLLFVAGAGWTKKQSDGQVHAAEASELIRDFLQVSGASLGSSKSLVDQGGEGNAVLPFLTHLNQVGQTGSTPRHAKGLATCCHGEEPHVVGWRFIGQRRAISLDPNCGWTRGKADVVYVADAFQVVARINALLRKERASNPGQLQES